MYTQCKCKRQTVTSIFKDRERDSYGYIKENI